jgi:plasmid maintenance system antidote protein VapI
MARPAIYPGEILADEIEELGLSASELARSLHLELVREEYLGFWHSIKFSQKS